MWYSANLVFKSVRKTGPADALLWEESIFLVYAGDEREARVKAEQLGKDNEHEYVAADGFTVRWQFETVESVFEIMSDTLGDGTELFSRFLDSDQVAAILARTKVD
jgi:hypothetical protein